MSLYALTQKLKARIRREDFHPSWLAAVISPVYIVRRGLYRAISELAPRVGGDVLDFGCGTKPYESLFPHATRYTGVDIEISGHDHSGSKVDVFYDGKTLPFGDGRFDSIVSFEVFEHVFNIDEILREVARVLKPEGHLLLSIPFAWEEHEVPYDFARYTSFGLEHILRRAGFDVVRTIKSTTAVLAIVQLFIAYVAKNVSPQSRVAAIVFQLLIIFPLNVFALLMNAVLPKRDGYFSNCIVLCVKRP